jgi:hypothetical protein
MRRTTIGQVVILSLFAAPILAQTLATPRTAYDRAAETAIAGTIIGVDAYPAADGTVGVHLEVNTGRELVRIAAGPATHIGQNNFSFLIDEPRSSAREPLATDTRRYGHGQLPRDRRCWSCALTTARRDGLRQPTARTVAA